MMKTRDGGISVKPKILKLLERFSTFKKEENLIYNILNKCNKVFVSGRLGYSRAGFYKKIKNRSFTTHELIKICTILSEFDEKDMHLSRVGRIKYVQQAAILSKFIKSHGTKDV